MKKSISKFLAGVLLLKWRHMKLFVIALVFYRCSWRRALHWPSIQQTRSPLNYFFSHVTKFDFSPCPILRIWSQAAPLRLVICSGVLLKPAALRATSLPQTSITFVSSSKFSSEVKKKLALQRNVSAGQIIRAHCSTIKPPQMPQRQRRLVGISADNLSLNNFF